MHSFYGAVFTFILAHYAAMNGAYTLPDTPCAQSFSRISP